MKLNNSKKILASLLVVLLALSFAACAAPKEEEQQQQQDSARDYTYFAGKDIAVITGVLTYSTTESIGGNPVAYPNSSAAVEDLQAGRVAGFMHALSAVQVIADQLGSDFEVIVIPQDIFSAEIGAFAHDQELIDRFNEFLDTIKADETLGHMQTRWFGSNRDLNVPLPEIENSGENGVLTAVICSDSTPYVFIDQNGNYSGYSVELALRFGAYEQKTVEFVDVDFAELIPYISDEKADFGLANVAITEERKQSVLFTDPYFDEQHGILALKL